MITQTIQKWLHNVFAWWPWGRPKATSNQQATNLGNASMLSNPPRLLSSEGPMPQTGMTTVAIEHEHPPILDTPFSQKPGSSTDQAALPKTSSSSNQAAENARKDDADANKPEKPASTFEQQLAYLRYLYQHGLINEGFADDALPRQYRKRRFHD